MGLKCHTNVTIFAGKKVENLDASSWMLLLTGRQRDFLRCSSPFNRRYSRRLSHPYCSISEV